MRSKWVSYDEPDSGGESRDYLQLTGAVAASYQPVRGTRITGSLGTGFALHDNGDKSEQSYSGGIRVVSRLTRVTLGGSYRGIYYAPLGAPSDSDRSLTSEFGVSLTWDPNE
jgi:hypothetical protein